jgi:hypothetical protein
MSNIKLIKKLEKLERAIALNNDEMENQFNTLDSEKEKLLRNFIKGKMIAYEEIFEMVNAMKIVAKNNL